MRKLNFHNKKTNFYECKVFSERHNFSQFDFLNQAIEQKVLDENNKFFCFQGRSFRTEKPKYITLKLDPDKNKVYGLNRVDKSKHILVVEGPIDSLFLDNCIAVAGSTNFAKDIPKENTTIVFDNERRNRELLKQIEKTIDNGYKVVLWPDDIKEKDITRFRIGLENLSSSNWKTSYYLNYRKDLRKSDDLSFNIGLQLLSF